MIHQHDLVAAMKISYSIDIDVTPEKVWYWLGDPERAKVWQTSVSKTETLQETPDIVGTTFRETIEENGRGVEMHGVITGYRENQLLAVHLSGQYNVVDVEWRLDEIEERTRVTVNARVRFKSFIRILSIIMRPVFKKKIIEQLQGEFVRLKEICERDN